MNEAKKYKEITTISRSSPSINTSIGIVFVPKTGSTYLSLTPVPSHYYSPYSLGRARLRNSKTPGSSHMTLSLIKEITNNSTPYFTVLRDPYDRAASEYYFIKRQAQNALSIFKNWDLTDPRKLEFLAHHTGKIMGISGWGGFTDDGPSTAFYDKTYNIHKYDMSVDDYLEWSVDNPTYPVYFDDVDSFDSVGITENMSATIDLLNSLWGIKVAGGNTNDNKDKAVGKPYDCLFPRQKFYDKSPDYEIYIKGKERFDNDISTRI